MGIRENIEKKIKDFPAMPAICGRLLDRIQDPDIDFKVLADEVKYDPGMAANILKLANSAYFGAGGSVTSIQNAIVRLGVLQVFQIVTAAAGARVLKKELKGYDLRAEDLLRHSVWVAVAAGEMADALGVQTPDVLFTAGLLHDVGKMVLDEVVGEESVELRKAMREVNANDSFELIEQKYFGMDHAEAGALILKKWNFPEVLVAAVRWHHEPDKTDSLKDVVNMVHIADVLGYSQGIGAGLEGLHYELSEHAVKGLRLTHDVIEHVASRSLGRMSELDQILNA
jgi:putative nucleotidyltransferase with HDIG domain